MLKTLLISLFFLPLSALAQLDALFDYKIYYTPNNWEPYIETHLSVNGNSMVMAPISNSEVKSKLGVVLILEKNNEVVNFTKYDLNSPIFKYDDAKLFYDIQRLSVDTGEVKLTMVLQDLNGDLTKADTISTTLNIPAVRKNDMAKIELIHSLEKDTLNSSLQKSGYLIMPKLFKYYPEQEQVLRFYTEIYFPELKNDSAQQVALTYYLSPEGKKHKHLSQKPPKRINANAIHPLIGSLDISFIPSGNYDLHVEVIDKNRKILCAQTTKVFRNNPHAMLSTEGNPEELIKESFIGSINSYDTLKDYIDCLYPIASSDEKVVIETNFENLNSSIIQMQLFFYNFWYARNSENPSESWIKYRQEVNKVNNDFSNNFRKGYESDRGIVYLKYGPPNSISSQPEPAAYPYEIWFYQQIANTSNRRFVFYNPTLAKNDYKLLHSDMQGELRNPSWVNDIYRRTSNSSWNGSNSSSGHWGTKAEELYNNPR